MTLGRHAEPADMPSTDLIATEDDHHYSVQSEGRKAYKNINYMIQSANVIIKVANSYIALFKIHLTIFCVCCAVCLYQYTYHRTD